MLISSVCDLLKIEYPVFGGAMAYISDGSLAGAVSEAGGFGIIASLGHTADSLRAEIHTAKSITKKPFGVNLMLKSPDLEAYLQVIMEEGVAGVTTGAGNPLPYMPRLKEAGIRVFPVVPSARLAKRMEENGADGVVVEGMEAGGHIGELTTMVLVPQVADAVHIPIVAAGGIGDGRGMAAAMMLGADGVQIGTRLMVTKECRIHPAAKQRLIAAGDTDTLHLGKGTSHSMRVLKSETTEEIARLEAAGADYAEIQKLQQGKFQLAVQDGDMVHGSLPAGQIAGLLTREESAAEMIRSVVEQAENLLVNAQKRVRM